MSQCMNNYVERASSSNSISNNRQLLSKQSHLLHSPFCPLIQCNYNNLFPFHTILLILPIHSSANCFLALLNYVFFLSSLALCCNIFFSFIHFQCNHHHQLMIEFESGWGVKNCF